MPAAAEKFTLRAPAAWAGRIGSADVREWMGDALNRRRPLPDDPGPGAAYLSLSLPRRAVRALEAVTGDAPSAALRRLIAAYHPAQPLARIARAAAPLPAAAKTLFAPARTTPAWLAPRPARNLPALRAASQLARGTAGNWPTERLEAYRIASDPQRRWAERQAAMQRLDSEPASLPSARPLATPEGVNWAGALWAIGILAGFAITAWLVFGKPSGPAKLAEETAPLFRAWAPVGGAL